MEPKNPININEGFRCNKCGTDNPKSPKSCRNHCKNCLWSKHVDEKLPGDRQSLCNGMMEPIAVIGDAQKGRQLVHECVKCGVQKNNKVAPDDDQEKIIRVMQRQNIEPLQYE